MNRKILTIVGARPQFIKTPCLSHAFDNIGMEEVLLHTGQHFDMNMSDIFFSELELRRPKYNLGVGGGSHGANTGAMIAGVEEIIGIEKPHVVLLYGDTDSTLAGAIAASKIRNTLIAHVEAGLRSFNRRMPEEINRVLTDHSSDILFPPTKRACEHLKAEGLADKSFLVGDVMLDSFMHFSQKAPPHSIDIDIFCTIHRAETVDNATYLRSALKRCQELSKNYKIVLAIHPRTQKMLDRLNLDTSGLSIVPPLSYKETLNYLRSCKLVLTDSGGLQKEAFFAKRPCITLRKETEWVELVDAGVNVLEVPPFNDLVNSVDKILSAPIDFAKLPDFYGKGTASEKIAALLCDMGD